MLAAGAVVLFVLEGRWPLAASCGVLSVALLWLSGFWVGPRSSDAYVRRVARIWREWSGEAEWAYNNFSRREDRYRRRIEGLRAPGGSGSDRERLLAVFKDVERARADPSIPYPDRVRRAVTAVRAIGTTIDELSAVATQDDQRRFCEELKQAREERRTEYCAAAQRAEQATEKLLLKLTRLRPPDAAAQAHAQMLRDFQDYLDAMRRFHTACRDEAPDEAAAAASTIAATSDRLRSSGRALQTSLGYDRRWPLQDLDATES
jgi:hypothetical protein